MKTLLVTCVSILFLCVGCDPNLQLEKVPDKKNTFELKSLLSLRVDSVAVYETSDPYDKSPKCVWAIKKKKRTPNKKPFRITVAEIPEGYIQVLPTPPGQFQLCKGQRYRIGVSYNNAGGAFYTWVAGN